MQKGERVDVLVAHSPRGPVFRAGTITAVYPATLTRDYDRATVRLDGQAGELFGVRQDSMRAVVAEQGRT